MDVPTELKELSATLASIESVVDLDDVAPRGRRPRAAGLRARPLGRRRERATHHLAAVLRAGRDAPGRGPAPPPGRHADAVGPGRGDGRRRLARRGRGRARRPAPGDRRARGAHAALRRVRRPRGAGHHPGRGRRRRRGRLRRHAAAHVPALGRAAQLRRRRPRHVLRRGGRHQVGHVPGQGALRLRHAVGRAGHAPAGAHQPLRQPGPAPDVLRRRRGAAGRRVSPTTSRSPTTRSASTSTARSRPGRSGRQHHRLGGAHHPPAHRHRGQLPERAQPDPEPRLGA